MSSANKQYDAIVLGAGAAGLFCAAVAGQRGRRVAVLEHNAKPGRKILISGGGRCNFTNLNTTPANYLSQNPHFCKSALARFTPRHFLEFVERRRIAWHEKTLGQLFCDRSSREILNMLLAECEASSERGGRVDMILNARDAKVEFAAQTYTVQTSAGTFSAPTLVVAAGGLSIPSLGATGIGYEMARQFGIAIEPTRPALVPLLLGEGESHWKELAGLSAEVVIQTSQSSNRRVASPAFREKLLFTHRGISGPAVLQASSYWQPGQSLAIDFAPSAPTPTGSQAHLFTDLLAPNARRDASALARVLERQVPSRLAASLAADLAPGAWTNAAIAEREAKLRRWPLQPAGTEGFAKAEVTAGGVSTAALDSATMQARSQPGLFFIGEVTDVTGWLGGYNFQWAWASAFAAAHAL